MKINKCKLGDLLYIKQGYAFKSEKYVERSQYRLCTLGNFDNNNDFKYNDEKAVYYPEDFPKDFLLNEGDLVLPLTEQTVGLFGNSAFIPHTDNFSFVLNQRVGKVIAKDCADIVYLHYLLSTSLVRNQIEATASGTKQRNTSPEKIYDVDVWVPDKTTQEEIGAFLHKFELKIQNNTQVCRELEAMAKTFYDYWFTQFDFPNEEGKPYRSSGGAMEWNEQLKREIPSGWKTDNIQNTCSVIDCLHSQKPEQLYAAENYYLLQLENLVDHGLIDLHSKYYVSKNMYELWTSRIQVEDGDLVVTNAGRVGAVSRIPQHVIAGIGRNMTAIRPNTIPPFFLYYFFKSPDFSVQMRANTDSGAFFGSLNVRGIKQLLLTVPPANSDILKRFDSIVEPMRRKIESLQLENEELTKLRDWLLPMLMNGQATVE